MKFQPKENRDEENCIENFNLKCSNMTIKSLMFSQEMYFKTYHIFKYVFKYVNCNLKVLDIQPSTLAAKIENNNSLPKNNGFYLLSSLLSFQSVLWIS